MMKAQKNLLKAVILFFVLTFSVSTFAQEEESSSPFSVGGDFVSSYVWRGSKIGSGPNIQPYMELALGNFTIGSWGSFSLHEFGDVMEADLYLSYGFDFGLSIGLTDYYYQGSPFFRFDTDSASHAFEVNLGYEIGSLSISANYILNDASMGGPANAGSDMYFELGYGFEYFDIFLGAGDGWHTSDGEFALCNLGISSSKEIKISDSFSLPVSGAVIVNPEKEEFNLVVGISF